MRVAVVGPGGIGGFVAAALTKSGHDVGVVARGKHLEAIRRDGLSVESSDLGEFTARVEATGDIRTLEPLDVVLLTFKSHQWPALWPQLESLAHSETTIVTLQNGVPFWYVRTAPLESVDPGGRIGAAFSDEQVVGGVVHVSGSVVGPGRVVQTGGLRYVFGPAHPGDAEGRARAVVEMFESPGLNPEFDPNVRATVWLKLVNNCGLNPVSALRRMTIRPMLADPQARAEVHELMEEALRVGQALGVVHDVDINARIEYASRLADVKTSMLQDLEAGRDLELDPILGATIELAGREGVAVPRLRAAYDALRAARRA